MARAKLRAGELGTIRIIRLPSGRYQAQARLCDEVGKSHQVKASGTTEALAETALREKADSIRGDTGGPTLGKNATVAVVGAVFLYDKGRSGMVEDSTMEVYEQAVRCVVVPACGDLLLLDFTARRCNRILADIREKKSLAAARKARSVLSQTCQTGIEYDILLFNPVRDARRLPLPSFTAATVRSQLARASKGREVYLFATETVRPLSVSNYERLLRTVVDDNAAALEAAGIDPATFSTHIFRRSTATLVEAVAGTTLASRLLGHANEPITRTSYVISAELVDPVTADTIDQAFADLL